MNTTAHATTTPATTAALLAGHFVVITRRASAALRLPRLVVWVSGYHEPVHH